MVNVKAIAAPRARRSKAGAQKTAVTEMLRPCRFPRFWPKLPDPLDPRSAPHCHPCGPATLTTGTGTRTAHFTSRHRIPLAGTIVEWLIFLRCLTRTNQTILKRFTACSSGRGTGELGTVRRPKGRKRARVHQRL